MDGLLPVDALRDEIIQSLRSHTRLVLQAPTGTGKSTRVPQFLIDHLVPPKHKIIVLQPRRMAARMLAGFIASERNSLLGEEVGYQVRMEGKFSAGTRILFLTEGILLRRLLAKSLPEEVDVLIFDEFHERHTETDLCLSLAMDLQRQSRPDLRILVMSATLETERVRAYMNHCPVLVSAETGYPVSLCYSPPKPQETIWEIAAAAIEAAMPSFREGSALVFMPGAYEISRTLEVLNRKTALQSFKKYPLHGSLGKEEQDAAVQDKGRKIIVTTNVAETSLTIPGITLVVDSGLAKVARFDARRGINTLFTEPISQASASQRAGRAGRTAPGRCIRLWSEFSHTHRPTSNQPEIFRIDLSESILGILSAGYDDINAFPWLEKPDQHSMDSSLELLRNLGALNENGLLTTYGRKMAKLPLHPRFGRMLMEADEKACLSAACVVAALEQSGNIFLNEQKPEVIAFRNREIGETSSDLVFELHAWVWAARRNFRISDCQNLGLNAFTARQVKQLAEQFLRNFRIESRQEKFEILPEDVENAEESLLRRCILAGFIDFLAVRQHKDAKVCQMMHQKGGIIHRDSNVQEARIMVAAELEETRTPKGIQILLKRITKVEEEWIRDLQLPGWRETEIPVFDSRQKKVVLLVEDQLNGLVIRKETKEVQDPEIVSAVFLKAIQEEEIPYPQWDEKILEKIRRINFTARHAPYYSISPVNEEEKWFIIQQSIYHCKTVKDIERSHPGNALFAWLEQDQWKIVDRIAPEHIHLPGRKRPTRLRYEENGDVVLSEVLQALYDLPLPVTVAEGKVPVVFEILSPARRPVQITRDLERFWKTSYQDVKKDLKGRYPKHEWR